MTNFDFQDIDQVKDIESINMHSERLEKGYDKEDIMDSIRKIGRDNARTPMQWDDSKNAGFTTGTPWIEVNSNYKEINVKNALEDNNSIFYTYKKLIELRKNNPWIVYGTFELVESDDNVFSYLRKYNGHEYLVVVNFSDDKQIFESDKVLVQKIIDNGVVVDNLKYLELEPWDAFAVEVTE